MGADDVRAERHNHPNICKTLANSWTVERMKRAAATLQLPVDEVETATNLAESLRLSQLLHYDQAKSFPPALEPYAQHVMRDTSILSRQGTKTALVYSEKEMLLLLALYLLVTLPTEAVRLFGVLSQRSAAAVKVRLGNMIDKISKI